MGRRETNPSPWGAAGELADALPCGNNFSLGAALPADRRAFLKAAAALPCLAACGWWFPASLRAAAAEEERRYATEARFYDKLAQKLVQCRLCPRQCVVPPGERGYCRVRENRGGTYYTLVYSRVAAAHVDPVEKKPLFHFRPGSLAFSVANGGCNVNCKFCQNWELSQARPEELRAIYLPPDDLAGVAQRNDAPLLAFTYSEPIVGIEYLLDAAAAGHKVGLQSVVISNGFIRPEPLRAMCAAVDAIKVDIKSFSETYYREVVRGELKPVLETIVAVRRSGRWLELVYLVVPGLNDGDPEFRGLAKWIRAELGPDVPVHFTRFHPKYLLKNLPPTPVATLERAKAIADSEGLHFAYIGNIPGHSGENTNCPKCGRLLVERLGFTVLQMQVEQGKCRYCRQPVAGVWAG